MAAGSGTHSLDAIEDLRDKGDRTSVFKVMPAHGLTLSQIIYPPDDEVGQRADLTRSRRELTDDAPIA